MKAKQLPKIHLLLEYNHYEPNYIYRFIGRTGVSDEVSGSNKGLPNINRK